MWKWWEIVKSWIYFEGKLIWDLILGLWSVRREPFAAVCIVHISRLNAPLCSELALARSGRTCLQTDSLSCSSSCPVARISRTWHMYRWSPLVWNCLSGVYSRLLWRPLVSGGPSSHVGGLPHAVWHSAETGSWAWLGVNAAASCSTYRRRGCPAIT